MHGNDEWRDEATELEDRVVARLIGDGVLRAVAPAGVIALNDKRVERTGVVRRRAGRLAVGLAAAAVLFLSGVAVGEGRTSSVGGPILIGGVSDAFRSGSDQRFVRELAARAVEYGAMLSLVDENDDVARLVALESFALPAQQAMRLQPRGGWSLALQSVVPVFDLLPVAARSETTAVAGQVRDDQVALMSASSLIWY